MQINIVKDTNAFRSLKESWSLLYCSTNSSVFQSFECNYFAWKHELCLLESNQLAITIIKDSKNIIAIFPFYVDSKKRLRFINDVHFDFCDIISKKNIDINHVLGYIKKEYYIKSIHLINLKNDSCICNELKHQDSIYCFFERYSYVKLDRGFSPSNHSNFKSKQKYLFIVEKGESKFK